jgi:hypothetical protein
MPATGCSNWLSRDISEAEVTNQSSDFSYGVAKIQAKSQRLTFMSCAPNPDIAV